VHRVLRADLPFYEPLAFGGRFLGVLVPGADPARADFLGPAPDLRDVLDTRLLRRGLQGERIAVAWYGPRREEVELCAVLPDDGREPVPERGATLADVLRLLDERLALTTDVAERAELVRLLVRCGTEPARALAVRHGDGPGTAAELLPLAERGRTDALQVLLRRAADLALPERERAFAAALAAGDAGLRDAVVALCAHADPSVAMLAGDALLGTGDPAGADALLRHADRHVRACGAGLALRFAACAGSLRVSVRGDVPLDPLAKLAGEAFPAKGPLAQLGAWTRLALRSRPDALRTGHKPLFLGERQVFATEFADTYTEAIRAGKGEKVWGALMAFLLDPDDPGRGIPPSYLDPLLDALEERAKADADLRRTWVDALVGLACAQAGMEKDREFLDLAQARLARLAGEDAPAEVRRKPGVYWPLWAARAEKP